MSCRDETTLDQLADVFSNFVFDEGQAAVTAYIEPLTAHQVRPRSAFFTPASRPSNPIQRHPTLVWQPPIVECRVVKPGAHS